MIKTICSLIFVLFLFQTGPILAGDGLSEVLDGIRTVYGRVPGFTVAYKREIVTDREDPYPIPSFPDD
ncbi:MAG: hypothetical protein JRJ06_09015 [Deltaproteobacteria bacterium]|nr:hypothetical protein [Deltaproteobacteria bacterium]